MDTEAATGSLNRRSVLVASRVLCFVLAAILFALTGWSILQRVTWYLSAWQFGYLTFARDLAHGTVFHRSATLDALRDVLPARTDVFAQTYVWDHGKLYCRYAPGFPLLLAGMIRFFGDGAVHYLNPVMFMLLLALLAALGWRVFGSPWLATVVPALVVLVPTSVNLWALTPMPDVTAHSAALFGLCLLLGLDRACSRRRAAIVGLALGYAVSIRPDAALYLVPAGLLGSRGGAWRSGALAGAALAGFLAGVTPLLAYNWLAVGNPFRPAQAMEVEEFFSPVASDTSPVADPGRWTWHGGAWTQVQGGGLRLANLGTTLPENIAELRRTYGDFLLALAAWGALLAFASHRTLFVATVPYVVVAFLFFSCWSHPDSRLLVGVYVLLPLLVLQGLFGSLALVLRVAGHRSTTIARLLALSLSVVVLAVALLPPVSNQASALPALAWLLATMGVFALLAAAAGGRGNAEHGAAFALLIGLTALAAIRGVPGWIKHARFQRAAMERARASFATAVQDAAVVITTEDVGRPMENIEYYAGVPALYLTDLVRWRVSLVKAVGSLIAHGQRPYLFIPPWESGRDEMLAALSGTFSVERTAVIPARNAIDYFVAAAALPGGVEMELYRVSRRKTVAAITTPRDGPGRRCASRRRGPRSPDPRRSHAASTPARCRAG